MTAQHRLSNRATMLAGRIGQRKALIRDMMAPTGTAVFSERLSQPDALAFWQKNRTNEVGAAILANWKPEQILELDNRLSNFAEMNQVLPYEAPLG